MRRTVGTALVLIASLPTVSQSQPPALPNPPLNVNIANQPVEVSGAVSATLDEPVEVTGEVNATLDEPVEVTGEVNAVLTEPVSVTGTVDASGSAVTVANEPTSPVPVTLQNAESDRFLAIGTTTVSTSGAMGGVANMNDLCRDDFADTYPEVRACTTVEAAATGNLNQLIENLPSNSRRAWVRPVVVSRSINVIDTGGFIVGTVDAVGVDNAVGPSNFALTAVINRSSLNCRYWQSDNENFKGAQVFYSTNPNNGPPGAALAALPCDIPARILCCASAQ